MSRLRSEIVYDFACNFLHFSFSVHTNHTQSTSAIFPVGCSEQSFTRLKELKERSTKQVVKEKLKQLRMYAQ